MSTSPDDLRAALRAHLEMERRLGIGHVAAAPAARRAAGPGGGPSAVAPPPGRANGVHRSAAADASRPPPGAPPASAPARPRPAAPPPPRAPVPAPAPLMPSPEALGPLPEFVTAELPTAEAAQRLRDLDDDFVRPCRRCDLCKARTQTVFGIGLARPELVFVGEGPGADEDATGEPFVGRAGQLLTKMIAAMSLTRDQVYICNTVKCRPPGNCTPSDEEMAACFPYLARQLAILRPKVIVALGRPAAQTLLQTKTPIGQLRGRFHEFPPPGLAELPLPRCPLMPTFHPAYLLRQPDEKGKAWDDLQQVMGLLGLKAPPRGV